MAQFAVFAVQAIPAIGSITHTVAYRGDHTTEAEAVNAAIVLIHPNNNTKVWAAPLTAFTAYNCAVTQNYVNTVE